MDFEKIMVGISTEIEAALKAMDKAKNPEEKLTYSKIVKNLTESLEVFLNAANDMMLYNDDDDLTPF